MISGEKQRAHIGKYLVTVYLGSGSNASVYLAVDPDNNRYAIKVIHRAFLDENHLWFTVERETRIHFQISHPNIVHLYEIIYEEDTINLVQEYCISGDLCKLFIINFFQTNQVLIRKILYQIADAMTYLHSRKIAHRDLKPDNIMLDADYNVKIGDFGMCCQFKLMTTTKCGSEFYVAPEILNGDEYDPFAADVWSFGILLYRFFCGNLPWDHRLKISISQQIRKGKIAYPNTITPIERDLMMRCLKIEPKDRCTFQQLLDRLHLLGYGTPKTAGSTSRKMDIMHSRLTGKPQHIPVATSQLLGLGKYEIRPKHQIIVPIKSYQ